MYLRQSTAQTVRVGPFLDSTDGVTAETGLTVAQADRQLSKDGGAFAQTSDTGNATHDTDGWYSFSITATDTDTVGELVCQIVVAGALPVWFRWYVVEEAVYDALYASGAVGPLEANDDGSNLTEAGGTGDQLTALATQASVDTIDSNVDAILVDTAEIGAAGAGLTEAGGTGDHLTAIPWNASWDAEVQSEVTDGLNAYDPPTYDELEGFFQLAMRSDAAIETDRSTLLNAINADEGSGAGNFSAQTEALEALRDRGDAAWITATGFSTHSAADVRTEMDSNSTQLAAIVADTNELQGDWANGGRLDLILDARASQASVDGLNDLSAAEVNTEVSDVLKTDTIAELTVDPGATPTFEDALMLLYMALRNQRDTSTSDDEIHNDAGTVVLTAGLTDNGTIFSKAKYA